MQEITNGSDTPALPEQVFEVPGYQPIAFERDSNGTYYLYVGDNFVAMSPEQWDYLVSAMAAARVGSQDGGA